MIGLRNVLAHDYDEIRYVIIWRICREKAPELIQLLEAMGVDDISLDDEEEPEN